MSEVSAGILLFRRKPNLQLLLSHPGGPLWWDEDEEVWTIPTGQVLSYQPPLEAARAQFQSTFGFIPKDDYLELGSTETSDGDHIHLWATEYQIPDDFIFEPELFEMEWPPESGQKEEFPIIDRIEYFGAFEARKKLVPEQQVFIGRLIDICSEKER
jgi:predicted NUDIX family NTP pyrophosphohydrolase